MGRRDLFEVPPPARKQVKRAGLAPTGGACAHNTGGGGERRRAACKGASLWRRGYPPPCSPPRPAVTATRRVGALQAGCGAPSAAAPQPRVAATSSRAGADGRRGGRPRRRRPILLTPSPLVLSTSFDGIRSLAGRAKSSSGGAAPAAAQRGPPSGGRRHRRGVPVPCTKAGRGCVARRRGRCGVKPYAVFPRPPRSQTERPSPASRPLGPMSHLERAGPAHTAHGHRPQPNRKRQTLLFCVYRVFNPQGRAVLVHEK